MANQSKPYLNGNSRSSLIFVYISQLLTASILLVYLGFWIGSFCPQPRSVWQIFIYMGSSLLLIVMVYEPIWNYSLGIANSVACGLVICWSGSRIDLLVMSYILGFFLGAVFWRRRSGRNSQFHSRSISLVILLIYIAGLVFIPCADIHLTEMLWWKIIGIGLFSILLVIEVEGSRLDSRIEEVLGLTVRIQILIHNLYWLIISFG